MIQSRSIYLLLIWFCLVKNLCCDGFFQATKFASNPATISNRIQPMHNLTVSCLASTSEGMELPSISPLKAVQNQWKESVASFRSHPLQYLSIPIIAALVGYVTNYVGVSMLFYPIEWKGIPIRRWPGTPYGLFGWQGIVPAKNLAMAGRMVDVTISKLLKIPEIFGRLESHKMATLLSESVSKVVYFGMLPISVVKFYLQVVSAQVIEHIESLISVKDIVVKGMTNDPRTLGQFFQKVGSKELQFLVESGTYFGFILGLFQMLQWMLYPKNWTLPVGGAVVGYVTNWIALKLIFEPLNPTKAGPFIVQGLFLTRQKEVSAEFSTFIARNVLTSQEIWKSMLYGPNVDQLRTIIKENVPFLNAEMVGKTVDTLKQQLVIGANAASHPLHTYTNTKIRLESTLIKRMQRLSPAEFEQVLHPIFQEDEIILILAGGVLGALAGGLQWGVNVYFEKRKQRSIERGDYNSAYESDSQIFPDNNNYRGGIGERLNTRAIAYGNSISKGGRDSRVKDGSGSGSGSYGVLQVDTHAPSLTKKVVKEYRKKLTPAEIAQLTG